MSCWQRENADGGVVLKLDLGPKYPKNLLTREALEELNDHLKSLAAYQPDWLVIASGKRGSFCAGANIDEIKEALNKPEELEKLLARAHEIFMKIHEATYPVVAAIDGECLGGGLELAMMCHSRIAANNTNTVFSLPETKLGIIPGFGGTQNLPKLVGLRKALEIINKNRTLNAQEAWKVGLVDYAGGVAGARTLQDAIDHAKKLMGKRLNERKPKSPHWLEKIPFVGKKLILAGAKSKTLAQTHGLYPAKTKAIDAAAVSNLPLEEGLAVERRLFTDCAKTDVAKNLVSIFLLGKEARSRDWVIVKTGPPEMVGVLGAGVMGRSIAYSCLLARIPVLLHDLHPDAIHDAVAFIEKQLAKEVKKGKMQEWEADRRRDLLKTDYGRDLSRFAKTDFVIEAIVEDPVIKHKTLVEIERWLPEHGVIATNTSSLLPSDIAEPLKRKENFCAMHFFNPAHTMELVEIAGTAETSPKAVAKTLALVKAMGKTPIVLDKECAGLAVNRVLVKGMARSLEQLLIGVDPWQIDRLMESQGMMMGPFKTLDLVGFDIAYHVMKTMASYYPNDYPQELLELEIHRDKKVLGQKTGKGFYLWGINKETKREEVVGENRALLDASGWNIPYREIAFDHANDIAQTVIEEMHKEAMALVAERVCVSPDMVDLALILGAGLFPNRRGLLKNPL